jgi:hypothetical protein
MSESAYRVCMVVLLAVFVAGSLVIGTRISKSVDRTGLQMSQNGRYVQLDRRKEDPQGGSGHVVRGTLDTRNGKITEQ